MPLKLKKFETQSKLQWEFPTFACVRFVSLIGSEHTSQLILGHIFSEGVRKPPETFSKFKVILNLNKQQNQLGVIFFFLWIDN